MPTPYRSMLFRFSAATLVIGLALAGAPSLAQAPKQETAAAYQELFAVSQKEKKGLMFWVGGQTIGGAVTKVIGSEAVEVRNQTYGRIIIRIDRIDALAIN
jgi:hypothetical protein